MPEPFAALLSAMNKPFLFTSIIAFAVLASAPPSAAQSSEIAELKDMVKAMQRTIAEQNARIATLEKQQAAAKEKPAAKPTASGRSVTVAGMDRRCRGHGSPSAARR